MIRYNTFPLFYMLGTMIQLTWFVLKMRNRFLLHRLEIYQQEWPISRNNIDIDYHMPKIT